MAEDQRGGPGAQHVGVIDVRSASDHRVGQRQHLAPRAGTTDTTGERDHRVDHRFQTEPFRQRRSQQQTGVGDQIRVIE